MKPSQDAAVALKYDGQSAPAVVATGMDEVAREITAIAREHNIPIYQNEELVALLAQCSQGDKIPHELYTIVAEIIAFAYWIQGKAPDDFKRQPVSDYDQSGPLQLPQE